MFEIMIMLEIHPLYCVFSGFVLSLFLPWKGSVQQLTPTIRCLPSSLPSSLFASESWCLLPGLDLVRNRSRHLVSMKNIWVLLRRPKFRCDSPNPLLVILPFWYHVPYLPITPYWSITGIRVQLNPCIGLTRRKRGQNFVTFRLLFTF